MTGKLTLKQERFCQRYVELGNASAAYRKAYRATDMKPATVNRKAKELMENGKITARIAELQKVHRGRHDITVDGLTAELEAARVMAMVMANPGAAIAASIAKAKLHGCITRPRDLPAPIKLSGSLTDQGQLIITAMSLGEVSPSDASSMLQAISAQARIVETNDLEKRVKKLEEKHAT